MYSRILCIDLMPRVKANRGIEITIFLIYVAYDPTLTKEFVRKFFPLTLNYAVADLGFVGVSNRLLHQRRNMLVQHIKSAAMLLRNNVGSIKHTLNSNRSTTPFLLPIANFRSNRLVPFLERASQEIPKSHEVQQLIRTLEADFRRQQKRVTINGVTYFTDDRNLIFKAPPERLMHGQNLRHNSIHGGGGHLDRCTVASRTRLGAPYKPTLHYDCNYEDRRVSRDFSNCHNELVRARNWTHANIAPNDWVG
jgi:hypothetical protein